VRIDAAYENGVDQQDSSKQTTAVQMGSIKWMSVGQVCQLGRRFGWPPFLQSLTNDVVVPLNEEATQMSWHY
jgi:hypothetical protein